MSALKEMNENDDRVETYTESQTDGRRPFDTVQGNCLLDLTRSPGAGARRNPDVLM